MAAQQIPTLESEWQALWQRWQAGPFLSEPPSERVLQKGFQRLYKAYSRRGRYYHNLEHLRALFKWWQKFQRQLQDPDTVALAIWYHDAVYNPLRKDNEARSAQWAQQDLSTWGLAPEKISTVVHMIEVTAHHHQLPEQANHDLLWFLDFDLSILASPTAIYTSYVEQVRKEYRWVPEVLYRQGRVKVLQHMLNQDFIYHTPVFRQHHERLARENLRKEIAYWNHLYV